MIGLLFLSLASPFTADSAMAQDQPLVDNVFFQSDLQIALEDIAAQTGVNIIVDPSVQGVVTVTLENVSIEKALQLVLAGTNYKVHVTPDYYLVYTPDETSDLFPDVAETRLIDLQYITPDTARILLAQPLQRYVRIDTDASKLAVSAPPDLLDRILEEIRIVDQPGTDETVFVRLTHVDADGALGLLPENLQRLVRIDNDRNTLAITASGPARERIIAQLRRLDVPAPASAVGVPDVHRTKVVKLNHAPALNALELLPPALVQYMRADEDSNSLAISAPDHLLAGIMQDIATIDVPIKHVMLDARVVILERGDLLDFGTDFEWPTIETGGALADTDQFPWELRVGYSPDRAFTNALSLTLNLLSENDEATIIASPQILAQDGREAEISVTTEEYFQITTETETFLRADLETIETGTILGIVPRIGPDGDLTLEMNIEVSNVIARGQRDLPVVSRRTARSTVQIDDGGTAAIAGLIDSRAQFNRSGVPGTMEAQFFGRALRNDALTHSARQIAVFVTATVVDKKSRPLEYAKPPRPPVAQVDESTFRLELEAALRSLGVTR